MEEEENDRGGDDQDPFLAEIGGGEDEDVEVEARVDPVVYVKRKGLKRRESFQGGGDNVVMPVDAFKTLVQGFAFYGGVGGGGGGGGGEKQMNAAAPPASTAQPVPPLPSKPTIKPIPIPNKPTMTTGERILAKEQATRQRLYQLCFGA
jgi:hypothetical protein